MSNAPEFTSISPAILRPRLPRIGNVKSGGLGPERTSRGGKTFRAPVKYDHFRVTRRARDDSGNFVLDEAVHRKIGKPESKPRKLDLVLMFNEIEHNWQTSFVAYDGKKLRCQGNGQQAYDRVLKQAIPCTCPLLKVHEGPYAGPQRPGGIACKPWGVLSMLLPDAETYGGFYVLRTTSWEVISSITASLQLFRQQFGGLAFLPLQLVLNPVLDTYEEGGQTKTSTTWKPSLVLAGGIDTAFQLAAGAQEQRTRLLQLSAGSTYTPEQHMEQLRAIAAEDEEEISTEFHPAQATAGVVDAEYEIEEDEVDPLETLIRRACQIAGADPVKTNNSIEKFRDQLTELAEVVQRSLAERAPDAWAQAKAEIEAEAEGGGALNVQDEDEPADEPETAQVAAMDLFS